MSKKEVVKHEAAPLPAPVAPGMAVGLAGNIGQGDMRLPRIELTQSKSPTVEDGKHKAGQLINSLTKEELGSGIITPVFAFKNVIRWKPRAEGGGILYKTMNITPDVAEDLKWNGDQKPLATAYINVVCLVEGEDMPLVASFCNTSYKAGQDLATLIQLSGCAWRYNYVLTTKKQANAMGSYYVFAVARGKPADAEKQAQAQALYETVKGMAIETDFEESSGSSKPVADTTNEDGL